MWKSFQFALLMGWSVCLLTERADGETRQFPIEVLVDGKKQEISGGVYRIAASNKRVGLRLGQPAEGQNSKRMRFKLEGVDSGWREMVSEMSLMVRFVDREGDQVGQQTFRVIGKSEGWNGTVEGSTFTRRQEQVRVPAGGQLLYAAISSSGPPTAIGVFAVTELSISKQSKEGSGPESLLRAPEWNKEAAGPTGWLRSGTHPSMARMSNLDGGRSAFLIIDDDPNSHAEWHSTKAIAPSVRPEDLLTLEWSELYNIGVGNRFEVSYDSLKAGHYRFLATEADAMGNPSGAQFGIQFVVLEPFWKSLWFWLLGLSGFGALIYLSCRWIIRNRIRAHVEQAEREHLIERERLRIARDIHDDLGARLTHISLVSALAEQDASSTSSRENFEQISGMTRDLVAALYQTVWTVNPENDHLEALVNFLCQLTQNLCKPAAIRCRIHSSEVPSARRVTSEVRHNICLAVKESLNNAIKHAGASEIGLRIEFEASVLAITITDDGRGFELERTAGGCGLSNLRRRMELIGGEVAMESALATGTRIRFTVPIP